MTKLQTAQDFFDSLSGKIEYTTQVSLFEEMCEAFGNNGYSTFALLQRAYKAVDGGL